MSPVMVAPLAALATVLLVCAPGTPTERAAARPAPAAPLRVTLARVGSALEDLVDVAVRIAGAR